jgi:hydrogenase nickel incorporation protein HypA/HybF
LDRPDKINPDSSIIIWIAIMHELGIAQNIYDIVQQSVPEELAPDILKIRIKVGQFAGIIPDSLDFCFNILVSETPMKNAKLCIEQLPLISECRECKYRFQVEEYNFHCPSCESANLELVSGKELEIVDIEVAEKGDEAL